VTNRLADIWVYLAATPLLFLALTLLVYQLAYSVYRRACRTPLCPGRQAQIGPAADRRRAACGRDDGPGLGGGHRLGARCRRGDVAVDRPEVRDHIGAIGAKYVLDLLRVTDQAVRGFAIGTAAHGIGTARAFQESEEAGAFSGLAMGLNGLLTAVLFPLALWLARQVL
jgi:hypothetical protein